MMRRLTIICGFLTLAVTFGLALGNHTFFGAGAARHQGVQVTAIPDRPASWPPVQPMPPTPPLKGLPPAPRPQPLQHAARGGATATPIQTVVQIANTLFNLPKIIYDRTQDTSR